MAILSAPIDSGALRASERPQIMTRNNLNDTNISAQRVLISPADLMVYDGKAFSEWHGDLFAAGLSSRGLVRIEVSGDEAREVARYPLDARIRSVAQAPDGALWVLEDERSEITGGRYKCQGNDDRDPDGVSGKQEPGCGQACSARSSKCGWSG